MVLSMKAVGFLINAMEFITKFGKSKEEEIELMKANTQITQEERDAICVFLMANNTMETVHVYLKAAGMFGHDELWLPTDGKGEWYFRNSDGWYYLNQEPSEDHAIPIARGERVPNNVLFVVHGYLDKEKFGSGNFIPQFPTVWDTLRGSWPRKCMTEEEAEEAKCIMKGMKYDCYTGHIKLDHEIDFLGYPLGVYEKSMSIDTGFKWKEYWFGEKRVTGPLLYTLIGYQVDEEEMFECTSEDCAYNNSGECRYCRVFDKDPTITEEDGCVDFVVKA